jgi:hypothetical protein
MPFGNMLPTQETDMNLETRLSIPPQVMSRLVGDETVLLNLSSGTYFGLDKVGKRIWETVSDGQDLAQTIAVITSEFDVDEDQAEADVIEFTSELVERGLLVE